MKRLALAGLIVLTGLTAMTYLIATGPRMMVQPSLRSYRAQLPLPPAGAVPVHTRPPMPTPQQAQTLVCPLPPTPANLAAGKTYYGYYCLACHAEDGSGAGPVGESYVPAPTDLRKPLRGSDGQPLSDGQLYRAAFTGVGHDPVLPFIVDPSRRWPIILYTRSLAK